MANTCLWLIAFTFNVVSGLILVRIRIPCVLLVAVSESAWFVVNYIYFLSISGEFGSLCSTLLYQLCWQASHLSEIVMGMLQNERNIFHACVARRHNRDGLTAPNKLKIASHIWFIHILELQAEGLPCFFFQTSDTTPVSCFGKCIMEVV